MFRDLPDDYKIDSIELDGEDRATVTFTAAGVNSTELAARVRELKSQILSDDWVLVINGSDDAELKKRDLIVTFYILEGMVRNEFMDVPSAFAETPIVKDQQFEIDLASPNLDPLSTATGSFSLSFSQATPHQLSPTPACNHPRTVKPFATYLTELHPTCI